MLLTYFEIYSLLSGICKAIASPWGRYLQLWESRGKFGNACSVVKGLRYNLQFCFKKYIMCWRVTAV